MDSGASMPTSFSSSAYKLGSNDDLLSEILVRLPVRSIIRSKSVSKHWFSLITDRRFSVQFCKQNPNPNPPSGLFLQPFFNDYKSEYEFIPFDIKNPVKAQFKAVKFDPKASDTPVLQSCNGLMLCQCYLDENSKYYVYNPTTKQVFALPDAGWNPNTVRGMDFVFDPSISPHYKVLCVRNLTDSRGCFTGEAVVDVYSSETGKWTVPGAPFPIQYSASYYHGVYCNNAIHWYDFNRCIWCYKFDEECMHRIHVPPLPDVLGGFDSRPHQYLLESSGSLFFVEISPYSSAFEIYELKKDYSGWLVKYRVVVDQVAKAFPEMVRRKGKFEFGIQSVVLGAREEDSFIVLELPGMAVRYNLKSKTFNKLCDLVDESVEIEFFSHRSLAFIESLAEVS